MIKPLIRNASKTAIKTSKEDNVHSKVISKDSRADNKAVGNRAVTSNDHNKDNKGVGNRAVVINSGQIIREDKEVIRTGINNDLIILIEISNGRVILMRGRISRN